MSIYSTLVKVTVLIVFLAAASLGCAYLYLHVSYPPVRDGRLFLTHIDSESTLLREKENGIHHIRADNLKMASYTQGFAHA